MRSWRDDWPRVGDLAARSCVRRSYCERHRRQRLDAAESREQRDRRRQYEFSEDESLVNSLGSSAADDWGTERRRQPSATSCLKSAADVRRNGIRKRVNFADEGSSLVDHTYAASSISDGQRRPRSGAIAVARRRPRANQALDRPTMADVVQSATSALEGLSLSSSDRRCAPSGPPRIVKARDALRRPATRRMLIYPPEGQRGEPLTLNKKWSKIQCRVNGNEDAGFRYKVYYLQAFESDTWFPNDETNSPFHHLPSPDDDSTDHGN